jgi:hypothetical protein
MSYYSRRRRNEVKYRSWHPWDLEDEDDEYFINKSIRISKHSDGLRAPNNSVLHKYPKIKIKRELNKCHNSCSEDFECDCRDCRIKEEIVYKFEPKCSCNNKKKNINVVIQNVPIPLPVPMTTASIANNITSGTTLPPIQLSYPYTYPHLGLHSSFNYPSFLTYPSFFPF